MAKKLTMLAIGIAALAAIAMPATAGASPVLEDGEGVLSEEATIVATSHNAVTTNTAFGAVECQTMKAMASLDANSGSEIDAFGTNGETSVCSIEGTSVSVDWFLNVLFTNQGDRGELSVNIVIHAGPFICNFEGIGEFEYETGNDVLEIPGIKLAGDESCEPKEGLALFEGDFTITTENGNPVYIN